MRWLCGLCLCVLAMCACWFFLVPAALKGIVRVKTGCELGFRTYSLHRGALVLKDVFLFDLGRDRSLRVREVHIGLRGIARLRIKLVQPHLIFSEELSLCALQNKTLNKRHRVWIEVVEGTYAWGKKEPVLGRFSFSPRGELSVEGDGGEFRICKTEKDSWFCSFRDWKVFQFVDLGPFSVVRGLLNGSFQLSSQGIMGQLCGEKILVIPRAYDVLGFSGPSSALEITQLEWRGVGSFERGKIFVREASLSCDQNKISQLSGRIVYDWNTGLHWNLTNDALLCEGAYEFKDHAWKGTIEGGQISFCGDDWDVCCDRFSMFLQGNGCDWARCSSSFSLFGGGGRFGGLTLSSLEIEGGMVGEELSSTFFKGVCCGMQVHGRVEGVTSAPKAFVRISGSTESVECEGSFSMDADLCSRTAQVEAECSHLVLRSSEGHIAFNELQGLSAHYDEAGWQWCMREGSGECFFLGRTIPFKGSALLNPSFLTYEGYGGVDHIESWGRWIFSFEDQIPFSFQGERVEGDFVFSSGGGHLVSHDLLVNGLLTDDPLAWRWRMEGTLSDVEWGSFSQGSVFICADSERGVTECSNLTGFWSCGSFRFPVRGLSVCRANERWIFDVRVEEEFYDFLRLKGEVAREGDRFVLTFDPEGTSLLDMPLIIEECAFSSGGDLEAFGLRFQIPPTTLLALAPRSGVFSECAFQGAALLDASVRLRRDGEGWEIFDCQVGSFTAGGRICFREGCCVLERGFFARGEMDRFVFSGSCDLLGGEFLVNKARVDLKNFFVGFPVEGKVEGRGSFAWNWAGGVECDFFLKPSLLKSADWVVENGNEIRLQCSHEEGVLLRGIDFHVDRASHRFLEGRIDLLQFDWKAGCWLVHRSEVHTTFDAFEHVLGILSERFAIPSLVHLFSPRQDLDCLASLEFSQDGSLISASLLDGVVPFFDEVRHIKNVQLHWNGHRFVSSFELQHRDHYFDGGLWIETMGFPRGRVFLDALSMEWEWDPKEGFVIYSVDGSCGGVEASFYKEAESKRLLGSVRCQFDLCADLLPADVAKIVRKLKMGKGYELKGELCYEDGLSFNGVLSGKACDLLGFQFRTLFTHVRMNSSRVQFSGMNVSDPAGVLNVDSLTVDGGRVSMPRLWLRDFRPSLLQRVGCDEEAVIAPFVIRDLKLFDFCGSVADSNTFTTRGELSFINSFKQGRTVLDLPADLLGRIVGLDLELLIPVQGTLKVELKERRFWFSDLQDSWSEGKRSKFFLVDEGDSPSIDLDGNLNILVKMKQYVLFKITENFLLSIGGTLESPDYHLQKRKRSLEF